MPFGSNFGNWWEDLERERNAGQRQNAALFSRVMGDEMRRNAPDFRVDSAPVPQPTPEMEAVLSSPRMDIEPPPERPKGFRDSRFGSILLGQREIDPQGGTPTAQYEDFLSRERPRPGVLQAILATLGGAAANSGRRPGQPLDPTVADDILFGQYNRQGQRLREAAQQELGQNRIDAIQTSADARISDVDRKYQESLNALKQRQAEQEQKQAELATKESERTIRELANRGYDPRTIDATEIPNYDPTQYVIRELPDGTVIVHNRNATRAAENLAPKAELTRDITQQKLNAALDRLEKQLTSRERVAAQSNATSLQRGREANATRERVAELMTKARQGDQDAMAALLGLAESDVANAGGGAAGNPPDAGAPNAGSQPLGDGEIDPTDERLKRMTPGQIYRTKDGREVKYVVENGRHYLRPVQ